MKITFNVAIYLQEFWGKRYLPKKKQWIGKKGEKIGEDLGLPYGIHYLKTRLESMEGRELI